MNSSGAGVSIRAGVVSAVCAAMALFSACGGGSKIDERPAPDNASTSIAAGCDVTLPSGGTPDGETPAVPSRYHGSRGGLWTILQNTGVEVIPKHQRSLAMKSWWWREVRGQLGITGRRLDGPGVLTATVMHGYGDSGFQASGLDFSQEGCWEVTGQVGQTRLTFVTLVVRGEE